VTLRVMTYNVRSLRDSRRAVTAVIARADPDVVCLQEVPRFLYWRRRRRRLAAATGLRLVAGDRSRRVAVAVLVRPGLEAHDADERLLPLTPGLHRRSTASATVHVGGAAVRVVSVHLGLDETERKQHARDLRGRDAAYEHLVLAGDLNDLPGSRTWQELGAGLVDAWEVAGDGPGLTFSARRPRRRIDGVLVSSGLRPTAAHVPGDGMVAQASDHRPVVVDLTLARVAPSVPVPGRS
jgi:endonuclease/exonuclease/phosphatase family metal-dependent hydrolase